MIEKELSMTAERVGSPIYKVCLRYLVIKISKQADYNGFSVRYTIYLLHKAVTLIILVSR